LEQKAVFICFSGVKNGDAASFSREKTGYWLGLGQKIGRKSAFAHDNVRFP